MQELVKRADNFQLLPDPFRVVVCGFTMVDERTVFFFLEMDSIHRHLNLPVFQKDLCFERFNSFQWQLDSIVAQILERLLFSIPFVFFDECDALVNPLRFFNVPLAEDVAELFLNIQ